MAKEIQVYLNRVNTTDSFHFIGAMKDTLVLGYDNPNV
jgi:hypothetical protein